MYDLIKHFSNIHAGSILSQKPIWSNLGIYVDCIDIKRLDEQLYQDSPPLNTGKPPILLTYTCQIPSLKFT